jgi:hypothetical protein
MMPLHGIQRKRANMRATLSDKDDDAIMEEDLSSAYVNSLVESSESLSNSLPKTPTIPTTLTTTIPNPSSTLPAVTSSSLLSIRPGAPVSPPCVDPSTESVESALLDKQVIVGRVNASCMFCIALFAQLLAFHWFILTHSGNSLTTSIRGVRWPKLGEDINDWAEMLFFFPCLHFRSENCSPSIPKSA